METARDHAHPAAALVHRRDQLADAGRRLDPSEHACERGRPARRRGPARASAGSSAKSTSPRIAASVAAATSAPRPASSAMSSMTSLRMSVESASSTTRKRADVAGMPSTLAPRRPAPCTGRSGVDVDALADHGDAGLGDREAARDVALAIDADRRTVRERRRSCRGSRDGCGRPRRRGRGRTAPNP